MKVHGAIGDNVNLAPLDELITNAVAIDCSAVTQASWIGLTSFNRYLSEKAGSAALVNIPYQVYRYFRLFPSFGKNFSVQSFEIPVFDPSVPDEPVKVKLVEVSELTGMLDQGFYDTLSSEPVRIEGKLSFWCPAHFPPMEVLTASTFANPWVMENCDEFCFWRNFIAFSSVTIGLSTDLLLSAEQGLNKHLKDISHRVESIEAGVARILNKHKMGLTNYIQEIMGWVSKECQSLAQAISELQAGCDLVVRRFQVFSSDTASGDLAFFYANLNFFAETLAYLKQIAGKIENAGETLGQMVVDIFIVPQLKAALSDIASEDLSPEILEQARSDFNIMDPMSEGSWPDTRDEVFKELEVVDMDICNCVVLLQGFDLVRQVLEHRISEGLTLLDAIGPIQKGEKIWLETKEQIIAHIRRSMVTAQEKFTFGFFFAEIEEAEKKPAAAAPGDMLFF
ncbi:MAG: hypothetical protein HQK54_11400 [Oligoflexales bacterium]|nr:hypothetical protein [Oligoflexales bacterium]